MLRIKDPRRLPGELDIGVHKRACQTALGEPYLFVKKASGHCSVTPMVRYTLAQNV